MNKRTSVLVDSVQEGKIEEAKDMVGDADVTAHTERHSI